MARMDLAISAAPPCLRDGAGSLDLPSRVRRRVAKGAGKGLLKSCRSPVRRRLAAPIGISLILWVIGGQAWAQDPARLCERAAHNAAQAHGIPAAVMLALTHVETGRGDAAGRVRPWPWALNIAGEGVWPATATAALGKARAAIARGQTSVDIGCFQINYRWHGASFPSLESMMDPARNADYAARFLRAQYETFGSWRLAAGAYHSRTEAHAAVYRARFDQALARVNAAPLSASEPHQPHQPSRRASAQLVAAGAWGPGSLLPHSSRMSPDTSTTSSAGAISMGMLR